MSEHGLPEDVGLWPSDPWELLGVERNVDTRELRRTYNRLLRLYKPDHHPEEFRRLREAFDVAQRVASWQETQSKATADDVFDGNESSPDSAQATATPLEAQIRVRVLEDELLEAWQLATAGNRVEAYARLQQTQAAYPLAAEPFLRLDWLLRLDPQLDHERRAADWLLAGLKATAGRNGPLRELWRRTVEREPQWALNDSADELLNPDWSSEHLVDFATWRWEAAARLGKWGTIGGDLDLLRPRLAGQLGKAWYQLLVQAVRRFIGLDNPTPRELADRCLAEIEQLAAVDGLDFDELAQLDLARSVADSLQLVRFHGGLADELLAIVNDSMLCPHSELRGRLMSYLRRAIRSPQDLLNGLIAVGKNNSALLGQFGILLANLENERSIEVAWTVEAARGRIVEFSGSRHWASYTSLRPALLEFCTQEFQSPQEVAIVFDELRPAHYFAPLAERIAEDVPLRYVCQAVRLFWA